ncbi:YgaP-like transmembrane domain [uncultured Paracoccus sp.]
MAVIAGVVLMITAAVRVCPLYTLLGMRTCRR